VAYHRQIASATQQPVPASQTDPKVLYLLLAIKVENVLYVIHGHVIHVIHGPPTEQTQIPSLSALLSAYTLSDLTYIPQQ